MTAYVVCAKCGLRHSTLVRHRCAKPKGQGEKDKLDTTEHDLEKGGETESLDIHKGAAPESGDEGDEDAKGKDAKGEDSGQGDGEAGESGNDGNGDGEAGKGEGQGEGEGEGQGPKPKPPEPEARPEAIICTVLKFAALTAQCAKNGNIEITVQEQGLFIYGHNGDQSAFETISWKDFEDRSTVDGEFFVKEMIDKVDAVLLPDGDKPMEQRAREAMDKARREKAEKPEAKPKAKRKGKPKLTVPMFVGQRVLCRDGKVREVAELHGDNKSAVQYRAEDGGQYLFSGHGPTASLAGRGSGSEELPFDALHDAEERPKLTLPLSEGQKVVLRNGNVMTCAHEIADCIHTDGGWLRMSDGKWDRSDADLDTPYELDAVADA